MLVFDSYTIINDQIPLTVVELKSILSKIKIKRRENVVTVRIDSGSMFSIAAIGSITLPLYSTESTISTQDLDTPLVLCLEAWGRRLDVAIFEEYIICKDIIGNRKGITSKFEYLFLQNAVRRLQIYYDEIRR